MKTLKLIVLYKKQYYNNKNVVLGMQVLMLLTDLFLENIELC